MRSDIAECSESSKNPVYDVSSAGDADEKDPAANPQLHHIYG